MTSDPRGSVVVSARRREFLPSAVLLLANVVFLYVVVVFEHHHVHEENSLLENVQAGVLALGSLFYLLAWRAGVCAAFCPVLALLGFSFFLREVDVEHLPLPELLHTLGSGRGKVVLLLVLWGLVAARFWRAVATGLAFDRSLLRNGMVRVLLATVGLLLVSFIMDKEYLTLEHARLYEELAETNAYLVLVGGGLAAAWASRRKTAMAFGKSGDTPTAT